MSYLEKIVQRGIEKGIEQGIAQVALNFLRAQFEDKVVAANTGLSLKQITSLKEQHGLI